MHIGAHTRLPNESAHLMKDSQQLRVAILPGKVLLQDPVDAGLQHDVVVAGHEAHLGRARGPQSSTSQTLNPNP